MATKKQKRLEGERRQAANRQAAIESGLKAQAKDRARRAKIAEKKNEEERRDLTAKILKSMRPADTSGDAIDLTRTT